MLGVEVVEGAARGTKEIEEATILGIPKICFVSLTKTSLRRLGYGFGAVRDLTADSRGWRKKICKRPKTTSSQLKRGIVKYR